MKLKKRIIYWKQYKFVLTYPADCEVLIDENRIELISGTKTTLIKLDLVKPEVTGNIPVAIRTPHNFSLIHKP